MDKELGDRNHHFSEHDLDAITNKISDLGKWREIFSQQGLQFKDTVVKKYPDSRKVEDESKDGAGTPQSRSITSRSHFTTFSVPYCVPKAFVVSSNLGGLPITLETAVGGIRSIQMAVQAHILKYLLFTRNSELESQNIKCLLGVNHKGQESALATALSDILWTAGEGAGSFVCLVTTDCYFAPTIDYKMDSYTERLQLFQFTDREKLQNFIAEHICCFTGEGSHAVILFIYSLLLSRTLERLYTDMDNTTSHLLQLSLGNFICTQALINLMLTGRASPNVFNGDLQYDNQGVLLKEPKHGVLARSDVGYLYWNRHELEHERLPQVGSMLKTPKLPIWLCNINDTFSVLFNTNRLLLSDWRMEHLFDLYFYSGQPSQTKTVTLTIDTHSHHWEDGMHEEEGDPEKRFPSVEMTIRTKWEGAVIDWNGTVPFF
ncbi:inactive ubiquitin carboxyl-terminal hydrolase MINDY-4B isoform X3 [Chiloscyllium plagiosum]|uniref:inactive ubiquitin carboxyl-terminal hydrolase MINDY-4B isoform X3 n=1 Tax=Chiloscyllium plagiosum TaxID=36176 RepID=UPI001CB80440|nr:inactive ubiquitin carboxyl-terminal hydrolase MINDY-4B isoform X3 [Chiloscyllium plagiosum]